LSLSFTQGSSVLAYRHIPAGRSPHDFTFAAVSSTNRWNDAGTPAVYLADGPDVCAAEYARHLDSSLIGKAGRNRRDVYEYDVRLNYTLDLRDPMIASRLGLGNIPSDFLDKQLCRQAARVARAADRDLEGLIVPSVAFLDDFSRCSLVVYLDRVSPSVAFLNVRRIGELGLRPSRLDRVHREAWLARQRIRGVLGRRRSRRSH
jgi:RES domain-containing protein